ncbi:hypothetical protein WJX77_002887 [Trebouxia sp. C0004]
MIHQSLQLKTARDIYNLQLLGPQPIADHPSLAAVGGSYGSAKNPRGNTGEGRSPWGSNAGRGNNGRGRSHQYSDSRPSAASPAQAEDLHHQLLHSCGNATPSACARLIHQPLVLVLILDGLHLTGKGQPYKRQST